jgi:DNA-damage-inducible protein J
MGTNTALIQVRVEPDLKEDVESILSDNGLDIPTAIRMFLAKVRRVQGLPFEVRTYSAETLAAFEEAELISRDPRVKTYSSFAEMLAEAEADLSDE